MAKTTRVVMPQLGESVHEGTIAKWLVKPGDKVVEFEPMLEVDTDKVSAEVPSPVSGILREILAQEGQTVQAGAEIAVVEVGADGEAAVPSPQQGEGRVQPKPPAAKTEPAIPSPPRQGGSPPSNKRARERGVSSPNRHQVRRPPPRQRRPQLRSSMAASIDSRPPSRCRPRSWALTSPRCRAPGSAAG